MLSILEDFWRPKKLNFASLNLFVPVRSHGRKTFLMQLVPIVQKYVKSINNGQAKMFWIFKFLDF